MKNKILLVPIILAAAVGAFFVFKKDPVKPAATSTVNTNQPTQSYKQVVACNALTQDIADSLLGGTATKGDTDLGSASSADIVVTNCIYSRNTTPEALGAGGIRTVSLLSRSAKTAVGAASNKAIFGGQKPAGSQDVAAVGDAAFWNPTLGQLSVLVGDNYFILSNGSTKLTDRTLDDAKVLYNRVVKEL